MTRTRPAVPLFAGAAAFAAAHLIQSALWSSLDGAHQPWFLNSGKAALLTGACFFAVRAALGVSMGSPRPVGDAVLVAFGGVLASIIVLFWLVGAGTLFPVALAIGALVLVASSVAGSGFGRLARRWMR